MNPLPIETALPQLRAALRAHPIVLLQAPPGAGKSTWVPLALRDEAWLRGQRIWILQPRRLAARAIAARMAQLCNEPLGQQVGYHVRLERRASPRTRVEVLTEGILTRRLQHDPALEGVGLIIFDEFHERSLHADLALALCREVQASLRPDVRILVMSATLDGDALSRALDEAPVVRAEGQQFPVEVRYLERPLQPPLIPAIAQAVASALAETVGDALVFLPGAAEIARVGAILAERFPTLAIQPLHGELPLDAQQAALFPCADGRRRAVLATTIAETSLTVEGVRLVIDAGYTRQPRFDPRTGLTRLVTTRVTRDAADQRAGRAGRLMPGVCYRLWTRQQHQQLAASRQPEILDADLTSLRLEVAQWGARRAEDLRWITPPPVGAWRQATALLQQLGALDEAERITQRGREILEWGTHPRLAHMLIEAQHMGNAAAALAADLVSLLEERDPLPAAPTADVTLRLEALQRWRRGEVSSADPRRAARVDRLAQAWRRRLKIAASDRAPSPFAVGALLALAYPDRVAQRRPGAGVRFRLANGRGAMLEVHDPLQRHEWLAVAEVDAGQSGEGRIFLAAPLDSSDMQCLVTEREVIGWDEKQGALVARREQRIGALVLGVRSLPQPPLRERVAVLCEVVRREGLSLLGWTDAAQQWRARLQSLFLWNGAPWLDFSDGALLAELEEWLAPSLADVQRREDFARLDVLPMLEARLPPALRERADRLAPARLVVPSGSAIRLRYAMDGSPPVLAVKLQEMFGLADTPTVNGGRVKVVLHLLSPAQRPIQVTQDLASFWRNAYPQVRRELRGRYPKHPWPEDPWNATPTRKTARG